MDDAWTSPYDMRTEDQLRELADERGCDLLVGDDRTLLVDLDTDTARQRFERMLDEIADTVPSRVDVRGYRVVRSRNGRWHGIVELGDRLDFPERIALQAILGSDPLREFLLLAEWMLAGGAVNCLFRPRDGHPDTDAMFGRLGVAPRGGEGP